MIRIVKILTLGVCCFIASQLIGVEGVTITATESYELTRNPDQSVTITAPDGAEMQLDPRFCILYSKKNPELQLRSIRPEGLRYNVPTWKAMDASTASELIETQRNNEQFGDGFDPRILNSSAKGRSSNLFESGLRANVEATEVVERGDGYDFIFEDHDFFSLRARITTQAGGPPLLSYDFEAKQTGYFSIGFLGAPEHGLEAVDAIWQPLIWQEKRMPQGSYMTLAFRCPVPSTMVTRDGVTEAMVVDADEFPFMPLPTDENSRFGIAVQAGKTWPNALALYQITKDEAYLEFAKAGADAYIAERIDRAYDTFRDPMGESMFFWNQVAPRFIPLFKLYETTGEQRYLDAAHRSARQFAQFVWMSPRIPDEDVLVNQGGKAPLYWYLERKGHKQMLLPEEEVPAWRLSAIGLTSESTGTSSGHRAIFMANYAPWLIRIGYHSEDPFLREIGRSAIVGRYRNFPGYHINTARTTAYEKADYPLRPHQELGVNSFHYNHVWPMTSMLLDYLVSEAYARSEGQIDFPAKFIEGYAYMRNKFYGLGKGEFYGAEDALLWMPKGLLQFDTHEINYISARGEDGLYLALMNESHEPLEATISLNPKLVPGGNYTFSRLDSDASGTVTAGRFSVTIPPLGLLPITIEGLKIESAFQSALMGADRENAWKHDNVEIEEPEGRAMILNFGEGHYNAYVHLVNGADAFREVQLSYDAGKGSNTVSDKKFPFEFTIPLSQSTETFSFRFTGILKDGSETQFEPYQLSKN